MQYELTGQNSIFYHKRGVTCSAATTVSSQLRPMSPRNLTY